jgi:hypothetical protein
MFLTWNNQADADASLAAVNSVYGCIHEGSNGYKMDSWANVTKSDNAELWGFEKPVETLEKLQSNLDAALVAGYTELSERPSDWVNEEVI